MVIIPIPWGHARQTLDLCWRTSMHAHFVLRSFFLSHQLRVNEFSIYDLWKNSLVFFSVDMFCAHEGLNFLMIGALVS